MTYLNEGGMKEMKINLNTEFAASAVYSDADYNRALAIMDELREDKEAYTGWVNWPVTLPAEWMEKMKTVAEDIRGKCDRLIVIGIGGSYLGTAAVLEALGGSKEGYPELVYAGNNMSGFYHAGLKKVVDEHDVCVCVVSKSGGTMESRLAFSIIKGWMYEKYGREETAARIVAITDPHKGILREESDAEGYVTFEIPSNIGGRYSAFTPGIMFPLAVAGVDIEAFVGGAKAVQADKEYWKNEGVRYALTRYALNQQGKHIEVFEYYDPSMRLIGEWCKQLFGESEGKEGKGLFPASLTFSTDLHSMGQFLQEGTQIFFETVINVLNRDADVIVPESAGPELAGRSLNDINKMAVKGVMAAHRKADIQIVRIDVEDMTEYSLGQLLYFFMMTAAVTGKLMCIDPFNQPGVEDYKQEIRNLLGQ
ncbi:MAG: glucose-6-phosphate isomerase [Mogibacterium sp.]|nr:glucose-6-phosphate isomerase [Mogibacterium sp.]